MSKVIRKEIKYPMSVLDFSRMRKRLECFVQYDPYSGNTGYRVRSLYFDSEGDRDLFDVLDGNMEKRKIRLRFYPPDSEYVRLEYKCKSGSDGVKRVIKICREVAGRIMKGDYDPLMEIQEPLALELYGRLMTGGYHPKAVVDYHRLAYTYPAGNTRLNFDSQISASYVTDSFFDEDLGLVPIMAPDRGVLEVKYDHFLVGILKEVVQSVEPTVQANSKYAQSRFLF